jgi:acetyl esterase/lipase
MTQEAKPQRPAPHPLVDPELAAGLPDGLAEELDLDRISERRAAIRELLAHDRDALEKNETVKVTEVVIPGPKGAPDVSLLIAQPLSAGGAWPAVYHIHGGGMVLGDNRVGMARMLTWMAALDLVVVSVDYRLAPEHQHPAPVEDCYAGLVWTADHAAELHVDPARLVIAGSSAGGGLAAATALIARDRGGPVLAHQILMCPMLDDRADSQSAHDCDGTGNWNTADNVTAWTALLGEARGGPDVSPYAAPARATDLRGLPPTFIDVGTAEIFRDEDVDYAKRLLRDGVPVELHLWPGGFHGFDVHVPDAALSRASREAQISYLRRALRPAAPEP